MKTKYNILLVIIALISGFHFILYFIDNSCNCVSPEELSGFYTCERTMTNNKDYLWLFNDSLYLRIFIYEKDAYISSNYWKKVKCNSNNNAFDAEEWIHPCIYGIESCHQTMKYVNKTNVSRGVNCHLFFRCSTELDNECNFRLSAYNSPYNYKRIHNANHKIKIEGKDVYFYSKEDSLNYNLIVSKEKHNIIQVVNSSQLSRE